MKESETFTCFYSCVQKGGAFEIFLRRRRGIVTDTRTKKIFDHTLCGFLRYFASNRFDY